MEFVGEGRGFVDEGLSERRVEPGLEIGLRVEAQDGDIVLLHAGYRRLEPIALQPGRPRLRGGDLALPGAVLRFPAGLHAGGDDGRDGRGLDAAGLVPDDMDVVAADQHRRGAVDPLLAFGGSQPALCVGQAREALQDHPVDLQRRIGRQQLLFEEAGKVLDEIAGLGLPAGEVRSALGPHAGLRDDADGIESHGFGVIQPFWWDGLVSPAGRPTKTLDGLGCPGRTATASRRPACALSRGAVSPAGLTS